MPKAKPKGLKIRALHAELIAERTAAEAAGSGAPADEGWVCKICHKAVTEDEPRREITCPSEHCTGRFYHEGCMDTYLSKIRFYKDRSAHITAGFPCPAVYASGKPCPATINKMKVIQPVNQRKKEATIANALANAQMLQKPMKLPPQPVPVKAGVQAAVAIMGAKDVGNKAAAPKPVPVAKAPVPLAVPKPGAAIAERLGKVPAADSGPRIIPGLDLSPQTNKGRGDQRKKPVAVIGQNNANHPVASKPLATLAHFASKQPGAWQHMGQGKEGFEHGGQFSALLHGALNVGIDSGEFDAADDAGSSSGSWAAAGDLPSPVEDATPSLFVNDADLPGSGGAAMHTPAAGVEEPQPDDPVVSYDVVYDAEDGITKYIYNDVLQVYARPEEVYGEGVEVIECAFPDGNIYLTVAVRESQQRLREAWMARQLDLQEATAAVTAAPAEAQAQADAAAMEQLLSGAALLEQEPTGAAAAATAADVSAGYTTSPAFGFPQLSGASDAHAGAWMQEAAAPVYYTQQHEQEEIEPEDSEVDSLLQLLCV